MPEVAGFTILCLMVVLITAMTLGYRVLLTLIQRRDSVKLNRDEAAQLEKMWQTLDRMEGRINNLETILLDREKHESFAKRP